MKWWKSGIVVLVMALVALVGVCENVFAGAWIGKGSGSSESGGPGDDYNCSVDGWWVEDCAGWSWAFYGANKKVNKDTKFEQVGKDTGSSTVYIPKECSEHYDKGGGFWHRGVNLKDACLTGTAMDDYPTKRCNGNYWTGHWKTIVSSGGWMAYRVPGGQRIPNNPQIIGNNVYTLEYFDASSGKGKALEAYKNALLEKKALGEEPGKSMTTAQINALTSIDDGIWGFCSWDRVYTLTVVHVDQEGNVLKKSIVSNKVSDEKKAGSSVTVRVDPKLNNGEYEFMYKCRKTKTSGGVAVDKAACSVDNIQKDETRYAVYKKITPKYSVRLVAVDIDTRKVIVNPASFHENKEEGSNDTLSVDSFPKLEGYEYPPVGWSRDKTTAENKLENKGLKRYTVENIRSDVTVYVFFRKNPVYVTLNGIAKNRKTGKTISKCKPASNKVLKGTSNVPISRVEGCVSPDKYTFLGWSKEPDGEPKNPNKSTYIWTSKMQTDQTVYLWYEPKDREMVTLSAIAMDYDTLTPIGKEEYNPDSVTLLEGSDFTLHSKYIPIPEDGPYGSAIGWSPERYPDQLEGTSESYTWEGMMEDNTVYVFYRKTPPVVGDCAKWAPSTYTNSNSIKEAETSTKSKVANVTLATDWQDFVYAKPTDKIDWIHCYYPGVQKMANEVFTTNHLDSENNPTCDKWSSSCFRPQSYNLNNVALRNLITFENYYRINRMFTPGLTDSKSFAVGDSKYPDPYRDDNYGVLTSQVGDTLVEKITTGQPIKVLRNNHGPHSWACNWVYKGDEIHHYVYVGTTCTGGGEDEEPVCTDNYDPVYWPTYGWGSTCNHSQDHITYNITYGPTSSQAEVRVPYNFENEIKLNPVDKNQGSGTFYAGETKTMSSTISTIARWNPILQGTYATKVPNAMIKLEVCYDSTCYETTPVSIRDGLNPSGNMDGDTKDDESVTFNVPDVPAGTEICMKSAVYPVNSYDYLSMSTTVYPVEDRGSWAWSQSICARVAKRPSVQFLGGNVFSNGKIVTGLSTKNLLYGWYNENDHNVIDTSRGSGRTFGSWGELGVISQGSVLGFASGNSLGYGAQGNLGSLETKDMTIPNRYRNEEERASSLSGGSGSATLCPNLSLLTVPNTCSNGGTAGMSGNTNGSGTSADLTSLKGLAESYANDNRIGNVKEYNGGYLGVDGRETNTFYHVLGNTEIGGYGGGRSIRLVQDSYTVIKVDGKATIMSDIEVQEGGIYMYSTLSQIPKMIIYATDIDIACDVSRIDAVLVAEGTVKTCAPDDSDLAGGNDTDDEPYNDTKNLKVYSNQLVVNGAIVARKVDFTRTYGAARGQNSIVSAEVINFDPTLYLWGGIAGEKKENASNLNGDLEATYTHELAPRQ